MKNLRANCLQVKVFLHNEGQCENDFWGRLSQHFTTVMYTGVTLDIQRKIHFIL